MARAEKLEGQAADGGFHVYRAPGSDYSFFPPYEPKWDGEPAAAIRHTRGEKDGSTSSSGGFSTVSSRGLSLSSTGSEPSTAATTPDPSFCGGSEPFRLPPSLASSHCGFADPAPAAPPSPPQAPDRSKTAPTSPHGPAGDPARPRHTTRKAVDRVLHVPDDLDDSPKPAPWWNRVQGWLALFPPPPEDYDLGDPKGYYRMKRACLAEDSQSPEEGGAEDQDDPTDELAPSPTEMAITVKDRISYFDSLFRKLRISKEHQQLKPVSEVQERSEEEATSRSGIKKPRSRETSQAESDTTVKPQCYRRLEGGYPKALPMLEVTTAARA